MHTLPPQILVDGDLASLMSGGEPANISAVDEASGPPNIGN